MAEPILAPDEEARRVLALVKGDPYAAFQLLERQFSVVVFRTQVLLSLSGIVITVTGFSGRAIAAVGAFARWSIASGIVIVLLAAAVAFAGVLPLRWLTQRIVDDPHEMVARAIALRNEKSRRLRVSIALFVVGFACYVAAIAQLLIATPTGSV